MLVEPLALLMIVTVTLNAAIDRTLLVPNFQFGQRHRRASASTSAGGKGINIARAARRLGVPVVCTGLAGGPERHAARRGAHERGHPQRLRPHSRGVENVDCGPRPDLERLHGDQRVGAGGLRRRARRPAGKARLSRPGSRLHRLRGLASPRRRPGHLRRPDPGSQPARPHDRPRLRRGCASLRDRSRAVPRRAQPAGGRVPRRARVRRRGRPLHRPRRDRRARGAQRHHHPRYRLLRALPGERAEDVRLRARAPRLEAVSTVGAGDTLLAGFIAARMRRPPVRGCDPQRGRRQRRLRPRGGARSVRRARGRAARRARRARPSRAGPTGRLTAPGPSGHGW